MKKNIHYEMSEDQMTQYAKQLPMRAALMYQMGNQNLNLGVHDR